MRMRSVGRLAQAVLASSVRVRVVQYSSGIGIGQRWAAAATEEKHNKANSSFLHRRTNPALPHRSSAAVFSKRPHRPSSAHLANQPTTYDYEIENIH